jgi:hypothetical protein
VAGGYLRVGSSMRGAELFKAAQSICLLRQKRLHIFFQLAEGLRHWAVGLRALPVNHDPLLPLAYLRLQNMQVLLAPRRRWVGLICSGGTVLLQIRRTAARGWCHGGNAQQAPLLLCRKPELPTLGEVEARLRARSCYK